MILTDKKAWELIEGMGWHKDANSEDFKKWWTILKKDTMKALRRFVDSRANDLYSVCEQYEMSGQPLEVGSDDSFSDLRYHVVGLGKKAFDEAMKDPTKLQDRYRKGDYQESFSYVFLEPEPPRTAEQKAKTMEMLLDQVDAAEKQFRTVQDVINGLRKQIEQLHTLAKQVKDDNKSA